MFCKSDNSYKRRLARPYSRSPKKPTYRISVYKDKSGLHSLC